MISRRTTRILADAFVAIFSVAGFGFGDRRVIDGQELYGFLFERDNDPILLTKFKAFGSESPHYLRNFILELHTGQSLRDINWRGSGYRHSSEAGQFVLASLVCDMLYLAETPRYAKLWRRDKDGLLKQLRASLELDGYTYENGRIGIPESNVIDEKEEEGILERLVGELGLNNRQVMLKHLEDSANAYLESDWWSCIGNARAFMESVLQEGADLYSQAKQGQPLEKKKFDSAVKVRSYLEEVGLFSHEEIMAVAHIWGLLSDTGNHPYIPEKDQARLGRNLALTISQYALLKLRSALK